MQVAKMVVRSAQDAQSQQSFNEKELLILTELGLDQVPSATSFVQFVAEKYSLSVSGIWYTLKKLKRKRVVDFMEKGEGYKPLSLTGAGIVIFRKQQNWPSYNAYAAVERAAPRLNF
ncbi:MAG: hypothetical protein M1156_00520 [Candidatus Marsarchaeota archaeon]|jgi:hypothetical protein|nr:hypothetical protein [Candidatus Marsarchaeota archaeon]